MQNQNYDSTKQVPCPFCNTLNKATAKFCRGCGKNISEFMIKDTSPKAVKKCPNCGTDNSTDADFCKECGSRLAQPAVQEEAAGIKPAAQTNACPNCGVINNPDAVFCKECGSKLAQPAVQEEAADVKPAVGTNACPNCGAINNPGAVFCKECGSKLVTGKTDTQPFPVAVPVPPAAPEPPRPIVEEPISPVMAEEPPRPVVEEPVPPVMAEPSKPVAEEPADVQPSEQMNACPNCGAVNNPGAAFCKECGGRLAIGKTDTQPFPVAAPVPPKPVVEEPVPPVMAEPSKPVAEEATDVKTAIQEEPADVQPPAQMNVCPNCGAVNNPGAAFCKECGGRLATGNTDTQPFPMAVPVPPVAPEPPKPAVEEPAEIQPPVQEEAADVQPAIQEEPADVQPPAQMNVCPNCGAVNNPGAAFCKECGGRLATGNTDTQPFPMAAPVPPVAPEPPKPVVEEPVPPVAPEPPRPIVEEPEPPVTLEPPGPIVEEPIPPIAPEPPKPIAEEPEKSNKKMMIIGGVAALVIAAGAFFALKGGGAGKDKGTDKTASVPPAATKTEKAPESKSVSISFDVPKGTKVVLDGKDVSSSSELDVAVGPHDIQLTHPLLSLVYDQKITVSNAGKLSPVREIKMSPDCKSAAEKAGLAMLSGILKQACDSDSLKLDPALFTGEADKNGKLTAVHKAMRNYAVKNSLKSLPVDLVNLGNLDLINKDGGKKFSVKCPAEFSGAGANGKKLNYSAHITFDIQEGKLMVASLDSFKAQ